MATILITGTNRGLGLSLAKQALSRPQEYGLVLATSRSGFSGLESEYDAHLREVERESKGRLRRVRLTDIGDVESCQELAEEVKSAAPLGINVLINNAGYAYQPSKSLGHRETGLKLTTVAGAKDLQKTIQINAFGPMLLSATLLDAGLLRPHQLSNSSSSFRSIPSISTSSPSSPSQSSVPTSPSGGGPSSNPPSDSTPPKIINISSTQASLTYANDLWLKGPDAARDEEFFHPIYATSKVALSGVTMHMARGLRDQAIVGQIHPGWLKTTMGRRNANLWPDESASHVLDVICSWTTLGHSGRYVNWKGETIPW